MSELIDALLRHEDWVNTGAGRPLSHSETKAIIAALREHEQKPGTSDESVKALIEGVHLFWSQRVERMGAVLKVATDAPGPGPLRNVDFWRHHETVSHCKVADVA